MKKKSIYVNQIGSHNIIYVRSLSNNMWFSYLNIANPTIIATDQAVMASVLEVNFWSVVPACIATNDGGATPKKVPIQNGANRTPITGDTKLMNQFGRNGVIRRKIM